MPASPPETCQGLPVLTFADAPAFAHWITDQPRDGKGLWLRLFRKGAAAGTTGAEAIDGALCHGWIDGQLGRYDDTSVLTRFTPRRSTSVWSAINRDRAIERVAAVRTAPAGLAAIAGARVDGRWDAAYAPASRAAVPDDLAANPAAAAFFATLTGANRDAIVYRVTAAAKPETRARRIIAIVAMLARGETIHD